MAIANEEVPPLPTVLVAGALAGMLDIVYAIVKWGADGVGPDRVLQGVAAGLLGRGAFSGGAATAGLGLLLHFLTATTAAAVYYLSARRMTALVKHPVSSGIGYGVCVYLFMNVIVLPLSAATPRYRLVGVILDLLAHMLLVGVPIALVTARSMRRDTRAVAVVTA